MRIAIDGADGPAAAGVANVKWDCRRLALIGVLVVVAGACVGREQVVDEATAPPADATSPSPVAGAPADADAADAAERSGIMPAGSGFLKSRQSPDGSWDGDVGTTGLVLLAFLGAGETHQSGTCRENVKNGLRFLCDRQDADGCFAPRTSASLAVDHALAALALTEVYGMTSSKSFAEPARRGVAFALTTRTPGGGWHRATDAGGELDVEATGWCVTLLKSALMSEVGDAAANRTAIAEAVADLARSVDATTGRAGAEPSGLRTAMVLWARILAGHTPKDDALLRTMADAVLAEPAVCDTATDVERTYIATMAIYQAGGRRWVKWNGPMSELLRARQRLDPGDPERGSWDATGAGTAAGRVRTTAIFCMTLEVYYRTGGMGGWPTEK